MQLEDVVGSAGVEASSGSDGYQHWTTQRVYIWTMLGRDSQPPYSRSTRSGVLGSDSIVAVNDPVPGPLEK